MKSGLKYNKLRSIMRILFYLWLTRGTAALWSSILPPWTLIINEKKSSSGTVAPLFCGRGTGLSLSSLSTMGAGNWERWSSRRLAWHLTSWSRKRSSGTLLFLDSANLWRELAWRPRKSHKCEKSSNIVSKLNTDTLYKKFQYFRWEY